MTLASVPTGLTLSFGSDTTSAPFTRTVIARSSNTITAPSGQTAGPFSYAFASWSDGLAASHSITAPEGGGTATYTAVYDAESVYAGTDAVGTHTSKATPGRAQVYETTATRTGTASALRLYVDAGNGGNRLVLGVYADSGGEPGRLLGSGALDTPAADAWNRVALAGGVSLTSGTRYWIAVLNPRGATGTLVWSDRAGRGGASRTASSTALSALPATWSSGTRGKDGPVSAAAVG